MNKDEFKEHKKNAVLLAELHLTIKGTMKQTTKEKKKTKTKIRKIGTSCMFHVNIHVDLKSRTGLM